MANRSARPASEQDQVRLLLTLPLGVLIGITLGAVGGGGSILAVPVLVYAVGLEAKAATTASLVVVGVAALGGMVEHWRAGRVRVVAGTTFGLAGVGGSIVGSILNRSVNSDVLLLAFSALTFLAAWSMWSRRRHHVLVDHAGDTTPVAGEAADDEAARSSPSSAADRPTMATSLPRRGPSPGTIAKVFVAGTLVGFATGFFGVGGGFVVVPALVLALGYAMPVAIGTSLLVIAINSAAALLSRVATAGVDWHVALPFAGTAVVGSIIGKRIGDRLPATSLMGWFVALLVLVATYMAIQSAVALWGA
jgi:uncharacterized membrane protein YfcA